MNTVSTWFTGLCLAAFAAAPAVQAQAIWQLERNTYANHVGLTADDLPPRCTVLVNSISRQLTLSPGPGPGAKGRLVIDRQVSTRYDGQMISYFRNQQTGQMMPYVANQENRRECEGMNRPLRSEFAMEFDGDRFTGTVLKSTNSRLIGEVERGHYEVHKGGRTLLLHFDGGPSRAYELQGPLNVTQPKAGMVVGGTLVLPTRAPDMTLVCRPISAKEGSSTSSSSYSQQSGGQNSSSNSSTGSTTTQCRDSNWQARRQTYQVWLHEKVCDSSPCNITEQVLSWPGVHINRYTGQMTDACFVWECERGKAQPKI